MQFRRQLRITLTNMSEQVERIVRPVALIKGRVLIKDSFPMKPVTSYSSQLSTDRRTLHFFVLSLRRFLPNHWAQVSVCPTQILWEDLNHFTASSPLLASVRLSPWKPLHYSADTVQWQWWREHDGERGERKGQRGEKLWQMLAVTFLSFPIDAESWTLCVGWCRDPAAHGWPRMDVVLWTSLRLHKSPAVYKYWLLVQLKIC